MYSGFDTRPIRDRMDEFDKRVYDQLTAERDSLDSSFVNAIRLLDDELSNLRAKATGLAPGEVVLTEKIVVPVDENPGYNFVGKLLGPKGITLKSMQGDTGTKMTILGKGSVRNRDKEDELRNSGSKEWEHLKEPLYVFIEARGPPNLAKARMAAAVAEVKKMLIPQDPHFDAVRQEQRFMMGFIPPPGQMAPPPPEMMSPVRGRGRGRGPRGSRGRGMRGGGMNGPPAMGPMHHGSVSPPGRNSEMGMDSRLFSNQHISSMEGNFRGNSDWKSFPSRSGRSYRDHPYERKIEYGHEVNHPY
ncbi:KH domain-containing, RNA-binding, signal transduction-associated protein 2 [Oopsacas minuta]|uniref:KH domain-containing, RNA-binding, signal transduction-associated protein 2 n=1 Tax=Oopsacas minuta TaxID=111878 RepID=A0AAV7KH80_9METZ|nr:KH domain-containing, RNA-binding, signal transduction-associated protein 2 [Oopsacas minuta]